MLLHFISAMSIGEKYRIGAITIILIGIIIIAIFLNFFKKNK